VSGRGRKSKAIRRETSLHRRRNIIAFILPPAKYPSRALIDNAKIPHPGGLASFLIEAEHLFLFNLVAGTGECARTIRAFFLGEQ